MSEFTPKRKPMSGRKRSVLTAAIALSVASAATFAAFSDNAWLNFGNGTDGHGFQVQKPVDIQVVKTDAKGVAAAKTYAEANAIAAGGGWQEANNNTDYFINFGGMDAMVPGTVIDMPVPFRAATDAKLGNVAIQATIEETPGKTTENIASTKLIEALQFRSSPAGTWVSAGDFSRALANQAKGGTNVWEPGQGDTLNLQVRINPAALDADIEGKNAYLQLHLAGTVAK